MSLYRERQSLTPVLLGWIAYHVHPDGTYTAAPLIGLAIFTVSECYRSPEDPGAPLRASSLTGGPLKAPRNRTLSGSTQHPAHESRVLQRSRKAALQADMP
jgi:hypothetical protein